MTKGKIPKRITTAIIQSFKAGVVPRVGLEHVAVGRKAEIETLLNDIDNVIADGGASFRFILGRYGSGKSFLSQLIRNYALQRNFVVMDADLSPMHRLTGAQGQGLNLYRELASNIATRTRSQGGALSILLERWINDVQQQVVKDGIQPDMSGFDSAVEGRIRETVNQMEYLVHSFDFATVLSAYWKSYLKGDDTTREAALRWFRGEYANRSEAREALGVRVIIDDSSWYDYIKIMAHFVRDIGYRGLIVFLDEAVNLYKISNTVSRHNNYERLLTIFNDITQGKAEYLGIIVGATPQMVEDTKRGLFSYEALRTRLEESRFVRANLRDLSGPMIRLETLTIEEIFVLLQRLCAIHAQHYGSTTSLSNEHLEQFLQEIQKRLGTEQLLTPREVVRDFLTILNILHQNPEVSFNSLIHSSDFVPSRVTDDPEELEAIDDDGHTKPTQSPSSPYANFEL